MCLLSDLKQLISWAAAIGPSPTIDLVMYYFYYSPMTSLSLLFSLVIIHTWRHCPIFSLVHSFSRPTIIPFDLSVFTHSLLFFLFWNMFPLRVDFEANSSRATLSIYTGVLGSGWVFLSFVIFRNPLPFSTWVWLRSSQSYWSDPQHRSVLLPHQTLTTSP